MRKEAEQTLENASTVLLNLKKQRKKIEEQEKLLSDSIKKIMKREKTNQWRNENEDIEIDCIEIEQKRFDSTLFKKDHEELFNKYSKLQVSTRLTIKDI